MDAASFEKARNFFVNAVDALLKNELGDKIPSEEELMQLAKIAWGSTALAYHDLSDEDYSKMFQYVQSRVTVQMEGEDICIEDSHHHEPWLAAMRSNIKWDYWERYKEYLEKEKHWNTRMIANLNDASDRIVDLFGNPKGEKPFSRRGLVIGDVQSGKTATYTALCNKATDVGYNIIIVLTGIQEDLRRQTQGRLDMEFAGRRSSSFLKTGKSQKRNNTVNGVARYCIEKKIAKIAQFTSTDEDFSKAVVSANNLDLKSINTTVLFVVKKNKSVLDNLNSWLDESCEGGETKIKQSLLMIDDEADNASVNTNKETDDPTAINSVIREILDKFYKSSYVGITATPFANIFINPDTSEQMEHEDLFPRDYIYVLDVPSNYIGPDAIFGDDSKKDYMLQVINKKEVEDKKVFPEKHKSNQIVEKLPKSLYEAMNYFLLVNAIRDVRGDKTAHRSMLIHVSRFISVHKQIRELVNAWLYGVQSDLRNYSKMGKKAEKIESIKHLHEVFDKHGLEKTGKIAWDTLLHDYLSEAVEPITVSARYQGSQDPLDYENHKEGLRVIAIGGNSFARGLTLEGLCVTYFYRKSDMYDTLMQMGRWFGYRPNYDDLCRIWMSEEAMNWFSYITRATNELKAEIRTMRSNGQTPLEFGLKVRQDPDTMMTVTARNKMRSGKMIKRPVTVSEHLLETPRLKLEQLESNKKEIKKFVAKLDGIGTPGEDAKVRYFWQNVPSDEVAKLLRQFSTDLWHLSFQGDKLADYIDSNMSAAKWDVAIPEGKDGDTYKGLKYGDSVLPVKMRCLRVIEEDGHVLISGTKARVGSVGLTAIGLSDEQKEKAKSDFHNKPGNKNKAVPDSAYLIQGRNPLLLLYVVQVKEQEKEKNLPKEVFALGVGFPSTGGDNKTAAYVVNLVELRKYFAFNSEDMGNGDAE
ncbi:MAG: Z1 domain-containing protein [Selenomonadaceae bacterium]